MDGAASADCGGFIGDMPEGTGAPPFDLDGTLAHSVPAHERVGIEWQQQHGLPVAEPAFSAAIAGRTDAEILTGLPPERGPAGIEVLADKKGAPYRGIAASRLTVTCGAGTPAVALTTTLPALRSPALTTCWPWPLISLRMAFQADDRR